MKIKYYSLFLLLFYSVFTSNALAHGGASMEDDTCVMTLGSGRVHFSAYQPEIDEGSQYCNKIPSANGLTIIVLDVIEKTLRKEGVGLKIYPINDQSNTLFYLTPESTKSGVIEASIEFPSPGRYVAEISSNGETKDRLMLEVEFTDWVRDFLLIAYNIARLAIIAWLLFRLYKYIKRKTGREKPAAGA